MFSMIFIHILRKILSIWTVDTWGEKAFLPPAVAKKIFLSCALGADGRHFCATQGGSGGSGHQGPGPGGPPVCVS